MHTPGKQLESTTDSDSKVLKPPPAKGYTKPKLSVVMENTSQEDRTTTYKDLNSVFDRSDDNFFGSMGNLD